MLLSQLPKIVDKSKKRVGRGHGSGKVKTAGRGTKGQKARGSMPLAFEGGQLPLIKRLPLLRGKDRNRSFRQAIRPLPVDKLNSLPPTTEVTLDTLRKYDLIGTHTQAVKIVDGGTLSQALTIKVPCTKKAKEKIIKAGGKVTLENE